MVRKRKMSRKGNTRPKRKMIESPTLNTKIIDLNEDCLAEICRYLDKYDLYNLKRTNKYFGKAIDRVVKIKEFKFVVIDFDGNILKDREIIGGFLYLFGNKIKSLNLEIFAKNKSSKMNEHIKKLIEKYCMRGNIKQFRFSGGLEQQRSFFESNSLFFRRLECLELDYANDLPVIEWLIEFIGTTTKLKKFIISAPYLFGQINENVVIKNIVRAVASSKLEVFHLFFHLFENLCINIDELPMNYELKELDFNLGLTMCDPAILSHFPNVEHLKYKFLSNEYSLDPILALPALKSLDLVCNDIGSPAFLAFLTELSHKNQLEKFEFGEMFEEYDSSNDYESDTELKKHQLWLNKYNNKIYTQLTENCCKMTCLRKLILKSANPLYKYLPKIGASLINLEEFTVAKLESDSVEVKHYTLELEHVDDLMQFVQNSKKLIFLSCDYLKSDVSNAVECCKQLADIRMAQGNKKVLYVKGILKSNECKLSDEQEKYIKFIEGEV